MNRLTLFLFLIVIIPGFQLFEANKALNTSLRPQSDEAFSIPPKPSSLIKGVFIMKVSFAHQACRTICFLTTFLDTPYPIHIFADNNYTTQQLEEIQSYAGNFSVTISVDTERWKQLPPTLTPAERDAVRKTCTNLSNPEEAKCILNTPLSYIYMGYWRYMLMAYEPALQPFEYFISIDVDASFTKPFSDPFAILAKNDLIGMFNVDLIQSGPFASGIQHTADALFSLEERRNAYLDTPRNGYFNEKGRYVNQQGQPPSFRGYFFGGRLDFFRSPKFREFAKQMVPYTYQYRTDEQVVIGVAWALLAGPRVWFLSQRNISMGLYHQGWVDHQQVVSTAARQPSPQEMAAQKHNTSRYWFHTLDEWGKFQRESQHDLLLVEEYVETLGYKEGHRWEKCKCARPKVPYVLRRACPNYKAMYVD